MSIPRLAIQRPVTMFMISAVITLLGVISLSRLPVDLMPEFEPIAWASTAFGHGTTCTPLLVPQTDRLSRAT